jgi:hypothetical protein
MRFCHYLRLGTGSFRVSSFHGRIGLRRLCNTGHQRGQLFLERVDLALLPGRFLTSSRQL